MSYDDETETQTVALDMDQLYDAAVDFDNVERVESDALLPSGGYRTMPVLSITAAPVRTGPNAGRQVFRVFGEVESTKPLSRGNGAEPETVSGRVGFTMSPERRNKPDGKPDNSSKLWANAVRAYIAGVGDRPASNRDVTDFLKSYPVGLRVGQIGEPVDNVVFAVYPLKD